MAEVSTTSSLMAPLGAQGHKIPELPWLDYASATVPTDHNTVMWWSQYLWISNDNYRRAMERVADHFITELTFPELEPDEESELKDFFTHQLNYRMELGRAGMDFLMYGNVFITLYLPFRRVLRCTQCGASTPVEKARYHLELTSNAPYVVWHRHGETCKCGNTAPYECVDFKDPDLSKVKLVFYSPFEIEMAYNRLSQRKDIWWKIDQEDRRDFKSGARIFIESTPVEVLEAVARGGNLLFESESVLHLDEKVISGIRTRGWGLPRSIASFRSAWLNQVINKADQAVAMDYTLGMRVISPAPTAGGGSDPMQTHAMDGFASKIAAMIAAHRVDPTRYHSTPYPLSYQFMGGEGATLVPPEKLKFRQSEFLNGLGVPVEFHQMSLTTQAAPMALRLFESAWQVIPSLYNQILQWVNKQLVRHYGLKETSVELQRSTIADDMMRKQVLTQLMAANQISPQTALETFGIDARDEVRRVYRHQDFVAKIQQETAEKQQQQQEMGATQAMTGLPTPSAMATQMQQQAQQGAPPGIGGGVPQGGMPGGGPATLPQMSEQAEQMAGQLVTMPEGPRKQQLKQIRESSKDLHALVTSAMDRIRRGAASQGQQMVLQQGAPQ
jgi:hypothetical protein